MAIGSASVEKSGRTRASTFRPLCAVRHVLLCCIAIRGLFYKRRYRLQICSMHYRSGFLSVAADANTREIKINIHAKEHSRDSIIMSPAPASCAFGGSGVLQKPRLRKRRGFLFDVRMTAHYTTSTAKFVPSQRSCPGQNSVNTTVVPGASEAAGRSKMCTPSPVSAVASSRTVRQASLDQ
jgi:hypothetical protein